MDDITILEKVNLVVTGLTSWNFKASIPSDIPTHNQYIPKENLSSNNHLKYIEKWTDNKKMILNQKKTKQMIFNYTHKHQFTTRMSMKNENLEIVKEAKLLGVIISDDLKWNQNTNYLIKKAYKRMELLRKASHFTVSKFDRKMIYTLYIRSVLEQSCVVWHSSLTQENTDDLERVQKAAVKIILGNQYKNNYEKSLERADLETLKERRIKLKMKKKLHF